MNNKKAASADPGLALKRGDQGEAVAVLQRLINSALTKAGHPIIVVDADFGLDTESALRRVQAVIGVTADGIYGNETSAALRSYLASPGTVLRRGDKGEAVAAMQRQLNSVLAKAGHATIAPDGDFGAATEAALKRVQNIVGVTADGIYGNATRAAVLYYLNSGPVTFPTGPVDRSQTTVVGGFRVHRLIAGNVGAMLEHAKADGFHFGGWGWRDPETQRRLRREHCGPTRGYDNGDYTVPASSCRPPTARPGSSMHERGLALDITYQGSTIKSRSSSAFKWLSKHAGTYGLKNLPSEPWHWSVNGR